MAENARTGAASSMDYSSSYAAEPSAELGTPNYYGHTNGVLPNIDSPDPLNKTIAWLPEADELKVFTADGSRFLSGPGVIPAQQALPVSHYVGNQQDTQHPPLDVLVSLDGQQPVVMTQSQSDELGDHCP
jgi:hypothetical protein